MLTDLIFSQLLLVALLWLCFLLHVLWPSERASACPSLPKPIPPPRKRSKAPQPFPGLLHKPLCDACEQAAHPHPKAPGAPPLLLTYTRGRKRTIDTQQQFCPDQDCTYYGWLGRGNLRSNGHPGGKAWRQFLCASCHGYFQQTHGTLFHGKRVAPERLAWAVGALCEGLGIRAVARVFEVDPQTVLAWLVEAADQLKTFSQYFLHDLQVDQVQLDELYALLSAANDGELSAAEAVKRLARSPHWGWVAMDPVTKLVLTIDVGERTRAMAQSIVHQLVQVLAPDCMPLFLTDGYKDYGTAILTHFGYWLQPPRRQGKGPAPKPRWMPLPQLRYAQVVKTVRRRRLVWVRHRVVFGTLDAVNHVLAPYGWQINTAFVERLNLDIRQHVAVVGRRVNTLCKHEAGLRQQLVLYQVYHNFVVPHASLRHVLAESEPTNGTGSAKQWRPQTPAMAAGLTDHVWSLREVLLYRVPPWPQPQAV
jgi:IS1 family transposase/transposase-like protein